MTSLCGVYSPTIEFSAGCLDDIIDLYSQILHLYLCIFVYMHTPLVWRQILLINSKINNKASFAK